MHTRSSTIKLLGSALLLAGLAACGIGESQDDSVQAKIQRDNEKLSQTYGTVAGKYSGILQTGGTQGLPAELQLYIVNVQDGVDPNNAPKSRLALKAQLKLLGVGELDDTNFVADFNEFDGRISMEQPQAAGAPMPGGAAGGGAAPGSMSDCPVGPKDARLSINGHILNGEIKDGLVAGTNGIVGTLVMKRTSSENKEPLRDQPERLRKAYARILGTYEGPVTSMVPDADTGNAVQKSANSQIIVRIVENPTVGGNTCPALIGQFKYTKVIGEIDDSQFSVSFRESTNEIFFTGATAASSSARVCPVGPKDAQLAIDGKIDGNKELKGSLKGTSGVIGDIDVTWKNSNTLATDDQRERLQAAYNSVAGTYGGLFDDANGTGKNYDFPVRITLNITNTIIGGFVRCPALSAQYARPDLYDGIGTILASADYFPFESSLTLKNTSAEGAGPGAGVPGHLQLSITAVYKDKQKAFSGDMDWWDRHGKVNVKKCNTSTVTKKGECG